MSYNKLAKAINELKSGKPLIVFDGSERENETDIIYPAEYITPKAISMLRQDAGGLICLAIPLTHANKIGLPFITDFIASNHNKTLRRISCKKTPYGDKPAFSVTINHKNTFTGITDNDRALTIKQISRMFKLSPSKMKQYFISNFYTPGHVSLLLGKSVEERKGHTELSLALMNLAKLSPAAVLCEMLDSKTGNALAKRKAIEYARKHNLQFVEKKEILSWVAKNEN
ncbi:3,4-dihydroxy-2-butanone-4-phosphate synthase [Candidatus Micrarchaeota archaeon]|nr:3,4-dihydroxy-2-butanone-4-phosphate synthase [Candidatus Micrarchaeota archaeon]